MSAVNWLSTYKNGKRVRTGSQDFFNEATKKLEGVTGSVSDWRTFLDALGKVEGNDKYDTVNPQGYIGLYQFDPVGELLTTLEYDKNIGEITNSFGNTGYIADPIAQELSALMEFSGVGPVANGFKSRYGQVQSAANISQFTFGQSKLDEMLGKSFTIQWKDASGNPISDATQPITGKVSGSGLAFCLFPLAVYQASV